MVHEPTARLRPCPRPRWGPRLPPRRARTPPGGRPWGEFFVLSDETDHKVKRIVGKPGRRLSYQKHEQRAEHWFVVAGEARVTLDGVDHTLTAGHAIDIPRGAAHRIESTGTRDLVF